MAIWSNYSNLTHDLGPWKVAFWKGNPLGFQGYCSFFFGWEMLFFWRNYYPDQGCSCLNKNQLVENQIPNKRLNIRQNPARNFVEPTQSKAVERKLWWCFWMFWSLICFLKRWWHDLKPFDSQQLKRCTSIHLICWESCFVRPCKRQWKRSALRLVDSRKDIVYYRAASRGQLCRLYPLTHGGGTRDRSMPCEPPFFGLPNRVVIRETKDGRVGGVERIGVWVLWYWNLWRWKLGMEPSGFRGRRVFWYFFAMTSSCFIVLFFTVLHLSIPNNPG